MRVLAASSWGTACGIAQYAAQLIEAVEAADPMIRVSPFVEALDPAWVLRSIDEGSAVFDVVWANWHRGLHSRWTAETVQQVQSRGVKVVITFHDTYGEREPDDLAQGLHDLADAFVVHEPCEGLPKQVLIRQGVPAPADGRWGPEGPYARRRQPAHHIADHLFKDYDAQPVLGTVGFNFPWKNFDRLAQVTAEAGWAYLVLSNNATTEDVVRWRGMNPATNVQGGFRDTRELVGWLAGCDATCMPYECANSGTSGAIRLCFAARKPVIAWGSCRQFRDVLLAEDRRGVYWCSGFTDLPKLLAAIPIQRVDPGIAYLAHRDSWTNQGATYAAIFQGLVG